MAQQQQQQQQSTNQPPLTATQQQPPPPSSSSSQQQQQSIPSPHHNPSPNHPNHHQNNNQTTPPPAVSPVSGGSSSGHGSSNNNSLSGHPQQQQLQQQHYGAHPQQQQQHYQGYGHPPPPGHHYPGHHPGMMNYPNNNYYGQQGPYPPPPQQHNMNVPGDNSNRGNEQSPANRGMPPPGHHHGGPPPAPPPESRGGQQQQHPMNPPSLPPHHPGHHHPSMGPPLPPGHHHGGPPPPESRGGGQQQQQHPMNPPPVTHVPPHHPGHHHPSMGPPPPPLHHHGGPLPPESRGGQQQQQQQSMNPPPVPPQHPGHHHPSMGPPPAPGHPSHHGHHGPPMGPGPQSQGAPPAMYGYQQQMIRREMNFPPGGKPFTSSQSAAGWEETRSMAQQQQQPSSNQPPLTASQQQPPPPSSSPSPNHQNNNQTTPPPAVSAGNSSGHGSSNNSNNNLSGHPQLQQQHYGGGHPQQQPPQHYPGYGHPPPPGHHYPGHHPRMMNYPNNNNYYGQQGPYAPPPQQPNMNVPGDNSNRGNEQSPANRGMPPPGHHHGGPPPAPPPELRGGPHQQHPMNPPSVPHVPPHHLGHHHPSMGPPPPPGHHGGPPPALPPESRVGQQQPHQMTPSPIHHGPPLHPGHHHPSMGPPPPPGHPSHHGHGHHGPPMGPGPQSQGAPPAMYGYQQQMIRREINFPPGTIESTQPILMKRRRLTPRDLGPNIDTTRLMMCLKSGLLAESTWALDCLSILFHDDSAFLSNGLQHIPGLLDTLIEHYKVYLKEIFEGLFDEENFKRVHFDNDDVSRTSALARRRRRRMVMTMDRKSVICDDEDGDEEEDDHELEMINELDAGNGVTDIIKYKTRCKLKRLSNQHNLWYNLERIEEGDGRNQDFSNQVKTNENDGCNQEKKMKKIKLTNCTNNCKKGDENCDNKTTIDRNQDDDETLDTINRTAADSEAAAATINKKGGAVGSKLESVINHVKSSIIPNNNNSSKLSDALNGIKDTSHAKINGHEGMVQLLSNSLNFTHKSRDGKPVNIVEDKNGLLIEDIENQWKKFLPTKNWTRNNNNSKSCVSSKNGSKNVLKSTSISNGVVDKDVDIVVDADEDVELSEDEEDKNEEWNNTCHILKSFVPKDQKLRFARVLKSCPDYKFTVANKSNASKRNVSKVEDEKKSSEVSVKKEEDESIDQFVPSFRTPRKRSHDVPADKEEESYHRDDPPLSAVDDYCDYLSRRCLCLSTLIRNLSFVQGKDFEMAKNKELMYILGRLLLLNHDHPDKKTGGHLSTQRKMEEAAECQKSLDKEDAEKEEEEEESLFNETEDEKKVSKSCKKRKGSKDDVSKDVPEVPILPATDKLVGEEDELETGSNEWYWTMLHLLLENSLVTLANISGCLDVSPLPEYVSLPLLDGLLHWSVCQSSYAQDALPTTSVPTLSPQRMALETLVKMSILDRNVDLILATPPWERLDMMFKYLTKLLSRNEDQTLREFSLVLLVNLSSADSSIARAVALTGTAIPQLICFLEQAEMSAMAVANNSGLKALRENPELMGTSLDMVRRSANCLKIMSKIPDNRPLFMAYQSRLLSLVMSQILDQGVASIMADIIYECSLSDPVIEPMEFLPIWNPPSPSPASGINGGGQSIKDEPFTSSSSTSSGTVTINGQLQPPHQESETVPRKDPVNERPPAPAVVNGYPTATTVPIHHQPPPPPQLGHHYPPINNVHSKPPVMVKEGVPVNGPVAVNGRGPPPPPMVPMMNGTSTVPHMNGMVKDENDSSDSSSNDVPTLHPSHHPMAPDANYGHYPPHPGMVPVSKMASVPGSTLELVSPVSMAGQMPPSSNPLERMQEMNNRGADSKACPRLKELLLSFTPSPRPFDGNNQAEQVS